MESLDPSFADEFNVPQEYAVLIFDVGRVAVSLPFQVHRLKVLVKVGMVAFSSACFEFVDKVPEPSEEFFKPSSGPFEGCCCIHTTYITFKKIPIQELVLRRIQRYRNPKQRSQETHAPHASTTVTHRILGVLPLCLNLNESKICRTGDTVYIFCICRLTLEFGHSAPRRRPLRRVKPRQFSPENVCGWTWPDRLHPDVVI